jgi:hypothetical protein
MEGALPIYCFLSAFELVAFGKHRCLHFLSMGRLTLVDLLTKVPSILSQSEDHVANRSPF